MSLESTHIRLTIDRRKIAWLKFILESYEGLALLVTLEAAAGRVQLMTGAGTEVETAKLLLDLKDELGLVEGLSDDLTALTGEGLKQRMNLDYA